MIITPLLLHQQQGLKYLLSHQPECALFWRMGTGKSLTALAYAEAIKACRVLITSDKSNVLNNWPDQIYQHTNWDVLVRPTSKELVDHMWATPKAVIVNYELLARQWKHYAAVSWDLWIGDESSEFKCQWTDKHRYLYAVVNRIPNKIILNGEPMTEQVEDLFGQFKMLDGGDALGSTITQFRERYMKVSADGYGWEPRRDSLTDIQRATKHISHWLMKPDIKMPERKYTLVRVDMTDEQKKVDDDLKQWFAAKFKDSSIEVKHAPVMFLKRVQLMGGVFRVTCEPGTPLDTSTLGDRWESVPTAKLDVVKKIIFNNPGAKIVIWHAYIPETTLLARMLLKNNIPFLVYDNPEDGSPLKQFADADEGVLLIRTSMCKGLNQLADADIAVIYSNPLSYKNRSQLEGRSQRMSSKTNVTHVIDIVTKGGMDEAVYRMLKQKKDCALTLSGIRDILDHS
jgi:hypothetical protein